MLAPVNLGPVDHMLAVDHEERRRRIAEVAVDLIASEGLE